MSPTKEPLTKRQLENRLIACGSVGAAVLGVPVLLLLLSDPANPTAIVLVALIAAAVGLAIGFQIGRLVWRKDMKRRGMSGLGDPNGLFGRFGRFGP